VKFEVVLFIKLIRKSMPNKHWHLSWGMDLPFFKRRVWKPFKRLGAVRSVYGDRKTKIKQI
jgi:hypothetical protein